MTTNLEFDSNESNQNNLFKIVTANKSTNSVSDLEENVGRNFDADGTQQEYEAGDNSIKTKTEQKELKIKEKRLIFIPDGKWQHDLYKDEEQKPKSIKELIYIYGYDIRNTESTPKAKRRK
ncbi:hypothetical protein PGB90_009302 [Kerria lacca]